MPKEFQFTGTEVLIQKVGDAVILLPNNKSWEVFLHGLNSFTEDFLEEGRNQGENQKRERTTEALKYLYRKAIFLEGELGQARLQEK